MDKIFLNELKIETIIGIWEWERKIRQTVIIDLEMSADIAKAAATDPSAWSRGRESGLRTRSTTSASPSAFSSSSRSRRSSSWRRWPSALLRSYVMSSTSHGFGFA